MRELETIAGPVDFDQCCWGLFLRCDEAGREGFIKKATRVLTSVPDLAALARKCPGHHEHIRGWGSAKIKGARVNISTFAGAYPSELCRTWAGLVATCILKPRRGHGVEAAEVCLGPGSTES